MKKTLLLLMTALSFSYGLEIMNFKESFNTFWSEAEGKNYETQQALFAKYIESKDPLFYKENIWGSTYDKHWKESRRKTLTKLFDTYEKVGIKMIDMQYDKYEKGIREVMQEFKVKVPDYHREITVMIAPGITWGGSYMRGSKKDYLGLGVDLSLTSPELLIKPLAIHETFHHYHQLMKLKKHPDFNTSDAYYDKEGKLFWQLWDEGMAVWGTSYITGIESLEYLLMSSKKNVYNTSKNELARYAKLFLEEIDTPAVDRKNPIKVKKWFGARVKDNPLGLDTPPMIGYALGYLVIKEIEKSGIPREEFMGWNYKEAEGHIKKVLKEMQQ